MKITTQCLKTYLSQNTELNTDLIAKRLTEIGFPVENIERPCEHLKALRIARITGKQSHPNNSELNLVDVEFLADGVVKQLQVVCGDLSIRIDDHAVLILLDEVLPSTGKKLKPRLIAGIQSPGMLCSPDELALSVERDGVYVINDVTIHTPVQQALYPNGDILDVEVTYNRGDLLCVKGIARELNAADVYHFDTTNHFSALQSPKNTSINVQLNNENMSYVLFTEFDIFSLKQLPTVIKNTLQTLNNYLDLPPVDIGNYISHQIGQPIHIFDADKIKGNIIIRESLEGENFLALNDKTYVLPAGLLVIADDDGVISVPGLIGGKRTSYQSGVTKRILVESAVIHPDAVTLSVQSLNLHTQSSKLFTHRVDEGACEEAIALFAEYAGLEPVSLSRTGVLNLEKHIVKVNPITGQQILSDLWDTSKFISTLEKLGFKVDADLNVAIPSFRQDIDCEQVLITEYVRLLGYDKIEQKALPLRSPVEYVKTAAQAFLSQTLHEVKTYKFVSVEHPNACKELAIINPMSGAGAMRKHLLPSLIEQFEHNFKNSRTFSGIFEISEGFDVTDGFHEQTTYLSFLVQDQNKAVWPSSNITLHTIQAMLIQLLAQMGIDTSKISYKQVDKNRLYCLDQNCCGEVYWKNVSIGQIGKLQHSLKQNVQIFGAEINMDKLLKECIKFAKTTCTPAAQIYIKDFSLKVPASVEGGEILSQIRKKYQQHQFGIFDVYKENLLTDRTIGIRAYIHTDCTKTQEELQEIYKGIENTLDSIISTN